MKIKNITLIHGQSGLGPRKHAKSGHVHNVHHFTGRKAGKRAQRKGNTHKERHAKRGTHVNKFAGEKGRLKPKPSFERG